jgi:hypothetical protein
MDVEVQVWREPTILALRPSGVRGEPGTRGRGTKSALSLTLPHSLHSLLYLEASENEPCYSCLMCMSVL